MKFVRPLLISLGVLVGVLAALVAVARIPAVQRWAVLRAAAKQPDLKLELDRISAGFSEATLEGVRFTYQGVKGSVARLDAEYSLWPALSHHRLSVQRLFGSEVFLDFTTSSPPQGSAATLAAPAGTPGVLVDLELPFGLELEDCEVAGRLLLPNSAGQAPIEASFEIKGGKFAPGQEGALILNASLKNPAADADVGSLRTQVSLRATQTTSRTFSRVGLTAVVEAAGRSLSEQNQLKIVTELVKGESGEKYSLSIDTLLQNSPENVLSLRAALPAGQREYSGDWTLKARTAQLKPFFLGLALPEFDARGEGQLGYVPSSRATNLSGRIGATASALEVIDPAWRAIGQVKLAAQFDVTADGPVARLRTLKVNLDSDRPVLELSASQAAEVDFSARRLKLGGVTAEDALRLKLSGVPIAWIAPFVSGAEISGGAVTGEFSIAGSPERIAFRAIRPLYIDRVTVIQEGEKLLSDAAVTASVDAVLTEKDLHATINELGLKTPIGDSLTSHGTVDIPVAPNPAVTIKASYTADLPALLVPWLPKGKIKAAGEVDLTWLDGKVAVRTLTTKAADATGGFLLQASTLRAFTFDPELAQVVNEKAPVDLVRIALGKLPLDWIPFLQPGAKLTGSIEPGEFLLRVEAGKLSLRAAEPLKLSGVGFAQEDGILVSGLGIQFSPHLEIVDRTALTAGIGDLVVRSELGQLLLTAKGEAKQTPADGWRANFSFTVEVPALASQPLFAGAKNVSEGRASGELRASFGSTQQFEARLTMNGLLAREGGQLLPVANLSVRAVVDPSGKISLQAPLLFDRAGQRSDLNVAIDLTPAGRNFVIDGKVTGDHVELVDAAAIAGVFSSQTPPPSSAAAASPARSGVPSIPTADPVAAWSRYTGKLLLDVKSVAAGPTWSMTGLNGEVVIEPAAVTLRRLSAAFGDSSALTAKAAVSFIKGKSQPYELAGDLSLTDFDAGKFFKSIDPGKPPTVEGLFAISGDFKGSGETLERAVERTQGSFALTSRQGAFRALQRTTAKVSMTSKAVELGASVIGSIFGSEKASKASEKVAGASYYVDQLVQYFSEFPYDQLTLKVVRDADLNVQLNDVSLISPEIRLLGSGSVTFVEGKSVLEQPLSLSLSLAARGKVEQVLGKLHLVEVTHDEVGYARTKEAITLGGTLARPNANAFFSRILTAKLSDLLDGE